MTPLSSPVINQRTNAKMNSIPTLKPKHAYLIANGDLRLTANQKCWPEQAKMETVLARTLKTEGWTVVRGHTFDKQKRHGFIDSQKMGMEVFRKLDPAAPLIVAECVWQYSHHLLSGLLTHRGPILTVANWSGTWPGLVGMLNLNGSMTKAGIRYSSLWSEHFTDTFFKTGLRQWLTYGMITHDQSHVRDLRLLKLPDRDEETGRRVARQFKQHKAIMGVFDEGCMGMFNAIIPDELLHPTGVFKERLSQSSLYASMQQVTDVEARQILGWLLKKGMTFRWGRADRSPNAPSMQNVHRGPPSRRRIRLFSHRHSIPAGTQRSRSGQRPGRGSAEQCGPAPREVPTNCPGFVRGRSSSAFQ
jgi:hypothetical protein